MEFSLQGENVQVILKEENEDSTVLNQNLKIQKKKTN